MDKELIKVYEVANNIEKQLQQYVGKNFNEVKNNLKNELIGWSNKKQDIRLELYIKDYVLYDNNNILHDGFYIEVMDGVINKIEQVH